ncbi:Flp pilus assembly complex ATPase component TadA [Myxococcota bacterium]|nr:Flp pilus assembly complex ATPase component TadA [Myxococcota bacterium]
MQYGDYHTQPRVRLGDLLVRAGKISEAQLAEGIRLQRALGLRLGSALVHSGALTEDDLADFLGGQLGFESVRLSHLEIDPELIQTLPHDFVKRFEVVPVSKTKDTLTIAMTSPNNLSIIDDIRFITGFLKIKILVASEMAIRRVIEEHYDTHSLLEEVIEGDKLYKKALELHKTKEEEQQTDVHQLKNGEGTQPIIALVNYLLLEAVRRRASDIHLEPYQEFMRVRMRIDGLLHAILSPPLSLHRPLISRVKVMAEMDISKTRSPQDGHIAIHYHGDVLHFRVNTLPTVFGEKCVIRLLQGTKNVTALSSLGFPDAILAELQPIIHAPQGLIIVTGPTGSGKSTTVQAALSEINQMAVNIVTLEDPVETTVPGINHVQIHKRAGLDFADALRAILRQDPDVVFVGEMRDREVARAGFEAAMTGHLVFSTLHTNSAVESLTRLEDMGVEMFLIAGTLKCVIAQRLVRRICPQCKKPAAFAQADGGAAWGEAARIKERQLYVGVGCNHCMNSGYKGRLPVFEVLIVDDHIRQLIRQKAPLDLIEDAARARGMLTLAESGLRLVLEGLTTPDEINRVVGAQMSGQLSPLSAARLEGETPAPQLPPTPATRRPALPATASPKVSMRGGVPLGLPMRPSDEPEA